METWAWVCLLLAVTAASFMLGFMFGVRLLMRKLLDWAKHNSDTLLLDIRRFFRDRGVIP